MKSIPLLDNYEDVVRLIKSPGVVPDSFLEFSFENNPIGNYLLIPIVFTNSDADPYSILPAIHSLHPLANVYMDTENQTHHRFQKNLNAIEKELKLTDERRDYFWSSQPNGVQLLIKVHCQFTIDPENLQLLKYCHSVLINENEVIKDYIQERILKYKKQKETFIFIQKIHQHISTFLHKLSDRIKPVSKSELFTLSENFDKIDCLKVVYMFANQILSLLEHDYAIFIDETANVSLSYLFQKQVSLRSDIDFINAELIDRQIGGEVYNLLMRPIHKLNCTLYGKSMTYLELEYYDHYCQQLKQLLQDKNHQPNGAEIESFLISVNFNSLQFFQYYCNRIKSELNITDSCAQKFEILLQAAKSIKQEVYSSKLKFEKKLPTIKEQLLNWIEQEAKYLKKIRTLTGTSTIPNSNADYSKINSGLSVAQIGYFCGLLMRSGIVESDNVSQLLRVICDNFKTANTENISHESLRQKYYSVEHSTVEAVQEKLLELVKLTKV